MRKLTQLLSHRITSVIILLISIIGRVVQKLSTFGLDDDKFFQVQAAKNLVNGHRISIHEVLDSNLAIAHYSPLIKWPPGYTLLVSPFYSVGTENDLWGTLWLDLLACIAFVLLARKLIQTLEAPTWLVNLFTLLSGFYLYDFFSSDSSDGLTLVFFIAAVWLSLKFLKSEKKSLGISIGIVFLLFSCCMLRYMYLPVAPLLPAYILLTAWIAKDKLMIRRSSFMLVSLLVLIGGILIYNTVTGGASTYMYPTRKGFFPSNLLETVPFLYSSAGNVGAAAVKFQLTSGIAIERIARVLIYSHFVAMAILFVLSIKWMWRKKFRATNAWDHYNYIFILSSIITTATLIFLSLTNAHIKLGGGLIWTYVTEPRYFAAPVFLFQLWIVVGIVRAVHTGQLKKSWAFVLLLPLILSLAHAIYFTGKKIVGGNKNFFQREELVELRECHQVFNRFLKENEEKKIVCASGDPMFNNFVAMWNSIPGFYNHRALNNPVLHTSEPVTLFIPVKPMYAHELKTFLDNPAKKYLGSLGKWDFYSLEVLPPNGK